MSIATATTAAEACITFSEYDETAFLEADLIFVGDLTDYEIVTVQGEWNDQELAVLTYRVDEVLKGEAESTIRLWWPNSTFGLPPSLARYDATLVAAVPSERQDSDWTEWFRYPSEAAITGLSVVHQKPCTSESIFPVGRSDIATIKRWIAAGAPDGSEFAYDGVKVLEELPARRTSQLDLVPIGGGSLGVGLLILALRFWQRRKTKALT